MAIIKIIIIIISVDAVAAVSGLLFVARLPVPLLSIACCAGGRINHLWPTGFGGGPLRGPQGCACLAQSCMSFAAVAAAAAADAAAAAADAAKAAVAALAAACVRARSSSSPTSMHLSLIASSFPRYWGNVSPVLGKRFPRIGEMVVSPGLGGMCLHDKHTLKPSVSPGMGNRAPSSGKRFPKPGQTW